jgi:hypothetical protein
MTVEEQPSAVVDWEAAEAAAERLGAITRKHVADRNADALRDWCLEMSRVHVGEGNAVRSLSYFELAVAAGHRPRAVVEREQSEWGELLQEAQRLAAIIAVKVTAEAAAKFEAEDKPALKAVENQEPEDEEATS